MNIKPLIKKQIIPCLPNYFYFDKSAVTISEDQWILKGFSLNKASWGGIDCCLFFLPLFIPKDIFSLTFLEFIRDSNNRQYWNLEEGNQIDLLTTKLEKISIEKINPIANLHEFYYFLESKEELSLKGLEIKTYTASILQLPNSLQLLDILINEAIEEKVTKPFEWVTKLIDRAILIKENYPHNHISILEEWKYYTIKELNIAIPK